MATQHRPRGPVLSVDNLCKSYARGVLVNDHVSLSLDVGEIFGLLGPNGAGKTTLVSQIIGIARPDSGRIHIDEVDTVSNPAYARQVCSFQAQTQVPISGLTSMQAIELVGRVRGGGRTAVVQRARELLHHLEMEEWSRKPAETFSGGMRRLVAFCMAAVVPGKLVILDEPTNDIDPLRRRLLWQEVRKLITMGSTVLLVTHNILEAERAVDRLAIMDRGRVVAAGTPGSLKGNGGANMRFELVLEPRAEMPAAPAFLQHQVVTGRRVIGRLDETDIPVAVGWARGLKESGVAEEYAVGPITLDDVYLNLVGRGDSEQDKSGEAEDETVVS